MRERGQPCARPRRIFLPNRLAHGINARGRQLVRVERRAARQQLVKQHAQAVDVAARINVQPAHLGLLRRHVGRRADELLELRVNSLVRQGLARGGLGDAEVNYFGHRHAIVQRDEDVRRLDVAVDDPLLVRVLNRLADLNE